MTASIYEGRDRGLSCQSPRYTCRRPTDCDLAPAAHRAREAYLAAFHAAEAYIFEHTGKVAKTHRGVRSEFARLAKAEPRIARDLIAFLGAAYQFKTRADYAVGSTAAPVTSPEAAAAIASTKRFIDAVTELLPPGVALPTGSRA